MKEKMAKQLIKIAKKLPNDKKKDIVDTFYKKNKDRPDIEGLMVEMKKAIDYKDDTD